MFNARTMHALLRSSLLLLVVAGCAHDTNWSWRRQEPLDGQVARPVAPVAARPVAVAAKAGTRRPLLAGPPSWRYGAKFEPPDGRILHGMGNWADGNGNYLAALGDPALEPAASLIYFTIGDWLRPWESQLEGLTGRMQDEARLGRILHLGMELKSLDPGTRAEVPVDVEVARSDEHDDHIRDVARAVREVGVPAFVRVGFEFSGAWNGYTPIEYPRAFRHVVELFREEGAQNAAFVWCWEPSAPNDFDQREQDEWRWYPGDDVVDWFGIDLFNPEGFAASPACEQRTSRLQDTQRFLAMAEAHGKPVMVTEASAVTVGITPDEQDGRRDWEAWFEPFFAFLAAHPGIKAFHYCNSTWEQSRSAQANGWLDSDISHNAYIAGRYARELRDPVYLHEADLHLLRGFDETRAPTAATGTPAGAQPPRAPPR